MKPVFTLEDAKRKMEQFCAYQDRCHQEVVQKLRGYGIMNEEADNVIVHLIAFDFLNEERFACSFARGKFRIKNWGKVRIVNELKARNISKYNIDKGLQEINPDEYNTVFHALAEKQWENSNENNIQKRKKKIFDFLMRKGFESQLIYEKINDLSQNDIS